MSAITRPALPAPALIAVPGIDLGDIHALLVSGTEADLIDAEIALHAHLADPAQERSHHLILVDLAASLQWRAAQHLDIARATALLQRAQTKLGTALTAMDLQHDLSWAIARTNLAILHLQLFQRQPAPGSLMLAQLSLDGVAAQFTQDGEWGGLAWMEAVEAALKALRAQPPR